MKMVSASISTVEIVGKNEKKKVATVVHFPDFYKRSNVIGLGECLEKETYTARSNTTANY